MAINIESADHTATLTWTQADDATGRIAEAVDTQLADTLTALGITAAGLAALDHAERARIMRAIAGLSADLTRMVRHLAVIARDQDHTTWGTLASLLGDPTARSTARSTYAAGLRQIEEDRTRVQHTADVVCIRDDGRLLTVRRRWAPFQGRLALPGGYVERGELPLDAAARELREETGVHIPTHQLTELGVWDTPGRDPRGLVSTTAYTATVAAGTTATAADDATAIHWILLADATGLAFDHDQIVAKALEVRSRS